MSGNSIFLFSNQAERATLGASSQALPVTNLVNSQRTKVWRSTNNNAFFTITLDEVLGADHLALIDLNLTTSGVIRVQAWIDAIDGTQLEYDQFFDPTIFTSGLEANVDYGTGDYGLGGFGNSTPIAVSTRKNITLIPFGQLLASPYYKVTFTDANLTYIQLGVAFLAKAVTYAINLSYGWNIRQVDRSVSKESIAGQRYIQPRDTRLQIQGSFGALSEIERTDTVVYLTEVGTTKPFVYSVFPEGTNKGLTTTIYGSFTDSNITNNFMDVNQFNFTVVEDL